MKLKLAADLSVPLELATEAIAILGTRGRGKTNTAVVMVEEMIGAGIPVAVVDTVGVWWGLRSSADGKRPGLPVVIFGGEHADVPLEETAGKVIADIVVDRDIACVIDTSMLPSKAAARRFLLDFVTRVYQRKASKRTPLHLVFDEADELAPQRTGPDGLKLLGAMEDFVRRGRSRGLGVTMVTQRPAVLNKDVLTQAGVLVAMGMSGLQDVKAIDEWVRLHADPEEAAKVKATLAGLPVGTGWFWSPQWLGLLEQVKFRERSTFDSSATPKIGQVRVEPKAFAQIDLAELGEQIAATVEKQKADDPRVLRARIAELEKQLRDRPAAETIERVVEVPVLEVEDRLLLAEINGGLKGLAHALAGYPDVLSKVAAVKEAPRAAQAEPKLAPAPAVKPMTAVAQEAVRQTAAGVFEAMGAIELSKLQRAVLTVLAQVDHAGRKKIGLLAGYASGGGAFQKAMAQLIQAGYIEGSGDDTRITDAGREVLGPYEQLPSGRALIEYWLDRTSGSSRAILEALVDAYPGGLTRAEIGEVTGRSSAGGAFQAAMAKLTAVDLVRREGTTNFVVSDLGEAKW